MTMPYIRAHMGSFAPLTLRHGALNGLQLRLQISGSLPDTREGIFRDIIGHQSVEKSEIRSGAPVKKVREAFQDSLSISGFAPFDPPLLETRGSDFRNARVQASISISGFDCISALGPLDFNFSP